MDSAALDARRRSGETKRRRTRAALLAATDRLLAVHGWSHTTVEAIALEAGVGPATVYTHFPTKDALAAWTLRPHLEDLLVEDAYADLAARDAVLAFVHDLCLRLRAKRHLLAAFVQAAASAAEPSGTALSDGDPRTVVPLVPALMRLVRRGQQSGELPADPPAEDVALMIVHGLLFRILVRHPEPADVTCAALGALADRILGDVPGPAGAGSSR